MPANLFISYAQEDRAVVDSLRDLAKNSDHKLEFRDRSELEPVRDKAGDPLPYPPNDERAAKVRQEIKRLLDRSSRLLVVVGETTSTSQWVDWEIRTFYDNKKALPGRTRNRMLAMRRRGFKDAVVPKAVIDLSIPTTNWNLGTFFNWLETNPNHK